ncbi:MAG: hypothetical protein ACTHU0_21760 [Kofleriaceae bacterium]
MPTSPRASVIVASSDVSQELVDILTELLAHAQRGEVRSVAFVARGPDLSITQFFPAEGEDPAALLGEVHILATRATMEMAEDDHVREVAAEVEERIGLRRPPGSDQPS